MHVAATGAIGLQLAGAVEPDVVIVDLGMADLDGIEICRRLRQWTSVPILVFSGDGAESRKIEALDAGADDCVSKPFSMPELLARVRVAIRHRRAIAHTSEPSFIEVGPLRIDTAAHEARLGGRPMPLTRKEFALLVMLARNQGRVIVHRVLLAGVWEPEIGRVELLRTHVNQLRRKLGEGSASTVRILNDPGVGYRLVLNESV